MKSWVFSIYFCKKIKKKFREGVKAKFLGRRRENLSKPAQKLKGRRNCVRESLLNVILVRKIFLRDLSFRGFRSQT